MEPSGDPDVRRSGEAVGTAAAGKIDGIRDRRIQARRDGTGTVFAIPKALKIAGLKLSDVEVFELNGAFAAQSLAVIKEAGLDPEKVNPNGGAIALGHPLGCTGAKLTATILRELQRRKARYGVVTMCVGGGMGTAGVFENLQ